MTAKEVFELRRLGRTEEAYEAAREIYAYDKSHFASLRQAHHELVYPELVLSLPKGLSKECHTGVHPELPARGEGEESRFEDVICTIGVP